MNPLQISIVIPVHNEQENLQELLSRLAATMHLLKKPYEIILIDDGSTDDSLKILREAIQKYPSIKVVRLNRNYGQHAALFAGFSQAQGEMIVTIDADLQNPPEEIPKLIQKMEEGYEVVGGYRQDRKDSIFRRIPSFFVAKLTSRLVRVALKDYGCMLRAYKREIVEAMLSSEEHSTYIPALANSLASSVAEIPIAHQARTRGKSKYSFLRLLHLNFDLMTSFSLLPIQLIGILGVFIALTGLGFSTFLLLMRLVKGSEWAAQGVFTLFGILFFFVGLQILAIGVMGEYIGRIYQEVRGRPRYRIQEMFSSPSAGSSQETPTDGS